MSLFAIIGLSISGLALIFIGINALVLMRRMSALRRRAQALQRHPTLMALKQAQAMQSHLAGLPQEISAIRERSVRIAENVSQLLAASALLELNVDRISFATTLFLRTFVPTLRGLFSDI